jgi:hypothetical protein
MAAAYFSQFNAKSKISIAKLTMNCMLSSLWEYAFFKEAFARRQRDAQACLSF